MRSLLVLLSVSAVSSSVFAGSTTVPESQGTGSKVICSKNSRPPGDLNAALLKANDEGFTIVSAPTIAVSGTGLQQTIITCVTATHP